MPTTQSQTPQTSETKRPNPAHREAGQFLPKVILDAPSAFEARQGSLERMRQDYGITRRRALELVLLGIIRSTRRQQR